MSMQDKALNFAPASEDSEVFKPGVWDHEAALARASNGNVEQFREELRRTAEEFSEIEEPHVTFEQLVNAAKSPDDLPSDLESHFEKCKFCAHLFSSLSPSEAQTLEFQTAVKKYRSSGASPARERKATYFANWGSVTAIAASLLVVAGGLYSFMPSLSSRPPNLKIAMQPKSDAIENCLDKSGNSQSCRLFVAAAILETSGKSDSVRPVLVSALKVGGVEPLVLKQVNTTLATEPAGTTSTRQEAAEAAKGWLVTKNKEDPIAWLTLAQLQFKAGDSAKGYEALGTYVTKASSKDSVGEAFKIAFVEPVKDWMQADSSKALSATE